MQNDARESSGQAEAAAAFGLFGPMADGGPLRARADRRGGKCDLNRMKEEDLPVHDWYRFSLSYPPHLVRQYLERFGIRPGQCVLDPFCGTGTTLVECKKQGIASIGIEANPLAFFASRTKSDWTIDPDELVSHAGSIRDAALEQLRQDGVEDNPLLGSRN